MVHDIFRITYNLHPIVIKHDFDKFLGGFTFPFFQSNLYYKSMTAVTKVTEISHGGLRPTCGGL